MRSSLWERGRGSRSLPSGSPEGQGAFPGTHGLVIKGLLDDEVSVSGEPVNPARRYLIVSLDGHLDGSHDAGGAVGMTKPFTLRPMGERPIVLDEPLERYLPSVVHGRVNDGRVITIRCSRYTGGLSRFGIGIPSIRPVRLQVTAGLGLGLGSEVEAELVAKVTAHLVVKGVPCQAARREAGAAASGSRSRP